MRRSNPTAPPARERRLRVARWALITVRLEPAIARPDPRTTFGGIAASRTQDRPDRRLDWQQFRRSQIGRQAGRAIRCQRRREASTSGRNWRQTCPTATLRRRHTRRPHSLTTHILDISHPSVSTAGHHPSAAATSTSDSPSAVDGGKPGLAIASARLTLHVQTSPTPRSAPPPCPPTRPAARAAAAAPSS